MTKSLKRIYERPEKIMQLFAWLSAAIVLFNFVLLCANVFMRYAFHSPIKGTTEIVAMMMAWVAYMGMPYTLLTGKHMQLEAIFEKLHGRTKHIVSLIIYLLAAVLFIIFVKSSFDVFWQSWMIREESVASVTVYVFIGKFGTFLGWLLLAVQAVLMAVYCIQGILHPDKYEPIGVFSEIPDEEELQQLLKDGNEKKGGADK